MRINRRFTGTIADRPFDTVVAQGIQQAIPARNIRRNKPGSMINMIDRIASMLNGSDPAGSEIQLADTPSYDKG